jgi:hypothetical protein
LHDRRAYDRDDRFLAAAAVGVEGARRPGAPVAEANDIVIEAWNTVLFD